MWIKYKWKDGDTFEKLAKKSKVKSADVILGYPKNKHVLKLHKKNAGIPIGVTVFIFDPKAKIYKTKLKGKVLYFGEQEWGRVSKEQFKLMSNFLAGVQERQGIIERYHQRLADARDEIMVIKWMLDEDHIVEPVKQRSKAQKAIINLGKAYRNNDPGAFHAALDTVDTDCRAYLAAVQDWDKALKLELANDMSWVSTAGDFANGAATIGLVILAAPATIPAAVLYGMGAGAAVSLTVDASKTVTTASLGKKTPSLKEIGQNAASSALVGGLSALFMGAMLKLVARPALTYLSTSRVIQTQATRLLTHSRIGPMIMRALGDAAQTMTKSEIIVAVTFAVTKMMSRIGLTAFNKYFESSKKVKDAVNNFAAQNSDKLASTKEKDLGRVIASGIMDKGLTATIVDDLIMANWKKFEADLISQISVPTGR